VLYTEADASRTSSASSLSVAEDANDNEAKTLTASQAVIEVTPAGDGWSPDECRQGAVSVRTYAAYVSAAGGLLAVTAVLVASVVAEGTKAFGFWWLAYWLEQGSGSANVSGYYYHRYYY